MALIKCSECGQMVSDKATKCPQCGNPLKKGGVAAWKIIYPILCLIVIASIGVLLYNGLSTEANRSATDSLISEEVVNTSDIFDIANSYLSIKDFLSIEKEGKGSSAEEMFIQSGYEKLASKDGCDYWGKNVKVYQMEVGHGGGYSSVDYVAEDTSKGSLIVIRCDNNDKIASFCIEVYEKEAFEKWKSQFLELGYKIEYDDRPMDEIWQNSHDSEEETKQLQKEGWTIGGGRSDGCWVDVMYFNKGNEEYTIKTEYGVETVSPNEYLIYKMSDHEYRLFAH